MKNTLENKAKFFAQYWWQEIFIFGNNNQRYRITKSRFNAETLKNPCWLELKSLSDITDEDAVELGYDNAEDFIKNELRWGELRKIQVQDADYLRSKSYALPFNGVSVEQQIEYGWIKLKL